MMPGIGNRESETGASRVRAGWQLAAGVLLPAVSIPDPRLPISDPANPGSARSRP